MMAAICHECGTLSWPGQRAARRTRPPRHEYPVGAPAASSVPSLDPQRVAHIAIDDSRCMLWVWGAQVAWVAHCASNLAAAAQRTSPRNPTDCIVSFSPQPPRWTRKQRRG
ncbi:hypothetical protein AURDEDRAFT_117222 [Auricularia subglabra TFB-10046 SS5]|nr:hypothetical protein AURDEDRAFT_117222 [Auricularia subglabra TFB-10046 SS5]